MLFELVSTVGVAHMLSIHRIFPLALGLLGASSS
jgi:hypothetical protein